MFSSTNDAEFGHGFEIPADNSESDFSNSSTSENNVCDTTNLAGSRKRSSVRRLVWKLKFFLLPSSTRNPPRLFQLSFKRINLCISEMPILIPMFINPGLYRYN